jgi:hypothetical protein
MIKRNTTMKNRILLTHEVDPVSQLTRLIAPGQTDRRKKPIHKRKRSHE